ncbi:MAG: ER lumen protein-retaining receptor 3 [Chaenotheca gracillima]|nr:MAG: ER lumen protein-retaining receptor 3 [Chaenotheca gracillima]
MNIFRFAGGKERSVHGLNFIQKPRVLSRPSPPKPSWTYANAYLGSFGRGLVPLGVHLHSSAEDEVVKHLFWRFSESAYLTIFKIIFIGSSAYTVYLMLNDYKPTHDPNIDTFKVQYLLAGSAVMALLFPYKYTPSEVGSPQPALHTVFPSLVLQGD